MSLVRLVSAKKTLGQFWSRIFLFKFVQDFDPKNLSAFKEKHCIMLLLKRKSSLSQRCRQQFMVKFKWDNWSEDNVTSVFINDAFDLLVTDMSNLVFLLIELYMGARGNTAEQVRIFSYKTVSSCNALCSSKRAVCWTTSIAHRQLRHFDKQINKYCFLFISESECVHY